MQKMSRSKIVLRYSQPRIFLDKKKFPISVKNIQREKLRSKPLVKTCSKLKKSMKHSKIGRKIFSTQKKKNKFDKFPYNDVVVIPQYKNQPHFSQFASSEIRKGRVIPQYKTKSQFSDLPSPEINKASKSGSKIPNSALDIKDRNAILAKCQTQFGRYEKLKALAEQAMQKNKVYVMQARNQTVRKALNERGWVEKLNLNNFSFAKLNSMGKVEMNNELERIVLSILVEKHSPDLIWKIREVVSQNNDPNYQPLINKLDADHHLWTSKQGLCSTIRKTDWFYIENVAEINVPRTFNVYNKDELDDFAWDFKITACTSLLKWILMMEENGKELFSKQGNISLTIIIFALNRCKEYIYEKQHKDIDRSFLKHKIKGWNTFLKNYYKLLANEDIFHLEKIEKIPMYLEFSAILLKEISKYRPQLPCEGWNNVWIIKPGHCSRGRGIRIASKLDEVLTLLAQANNNHIVQKYIEHPLLIHDIKFDIRQYYLVTSTFPLIIWMYKDCYLKFSSQKYNLNSYHESIHLTNYAVQRKYKNAPRRHPDLPLNNMWSLERYKEYLINEGLPEVWSEVIYPGMKKCIIAVMLNCQELMTNSKNRFELYGCDFILDSQFNPWLIEINSCPDLNPTTKVTAKICPAVLQDIIKVVIDHPRTFRAPTGNFECVYKQRLTPTNYTKEFTKLSVRGFSLPSNYFCKVKNVEERQYELSNNDDKCDLKEIIKSLEMKYSNKNKNSFTAKKIYNTKDENSNDADSHFKQHLDNILTEHENEPSDIISSRSVTTGSKSLSYVSTTSNWSKNPLHKCENNIANLLPTCISTGNVRSSNYFINNMTENNVEQKIKNTLSKINVIQKLIYEISSVVKSKSVSEYNMNGDEKFKESDETSSATSNIIQFLKTKHKEFYGSL